MSQDLFDTVIKQQNCKNDAELSRALKIDPGALSRMRHGKLKVGAVLILRIHKLTNIPVVDIEAMIGDKS
jgi:hypothetical protein